MNDASVTYVTLIAPEALHVSWLPFHLSLALGFCQRQLYVI